MRSATASRRSTIRTATAAGDSSRALCGSTASKTGPQKSFIGNENWDVIIDLDGSNNLAMRYVRGDAIDALFARIGADNNAYWYLTDRLGSIRNVTDNAGVVKDTLTYSAFGSITSESDANFRGRYAWTSREWDKEMDLQYNRARYYHPMLGRWMSQDPMGFEAGDRICIGTLGIEQLHL